MPKTPRRTTVPVRDPLYLLFEHFLLTRSYENAGDFTKQLAENYLAYLDSTPAHMPFEARQSVLEDLTTEAHEMLVKRMYGGFQDLAPRACGQVHRYDDRGLQALPLQMPDLPEQKKS